MVVSESRGGCVVSLGSGVYASLWRDRMNIIIHIIEDDIIIRLTVLNRREENGEKGIIIIIIIIIIKQIKSHYTLL